MFSKQYLESYEVSCSIAQHYGMGEITMGSYYIVQSVSRFMLIKPERAGTELSRFN